MTEEQITAMAREFAEEMCAHMEDDFIKDEAIKDNELTFQMAVNHLRQRFYLVEKSAVREVVVAGNSIEDLRDKLCSKWWYCSYELVAVIEDEGVFYAFLQSRKIQNYYDN